MIPSREPTMRRTLTLSALALAVACHTAHNPAAPEVGSPGPDDYRVLNGPATCDACGSLSFAVTGPDAYYATSAQLERQGETIPASIRLARTTGDSGKVLNVAIVFVDTVEAGDYDLRLQTTGEGGSRQILLPGAVVVTAAYLPPASGPLPPTGSGPVRILASVAGEDPDSAFRLRTCSATFGCWQFEMRANQPLSIRLPAGLHELSLLDVQSNCEIVGPGSQILDVRAGDELAAVEFRVACLAREWLRVTLNESGSARVGYAAVWCLTTTCGFEQAPVFTSGDLIPVRAGTFEIALYLYQEGCAVTNGERRTVNAQAGDTVTVTFDVRCESIGTIRVRTQTTGANPDGSYRIVDELSCDFLYYTCQSFAVVEPQVLELQRWWTLQLRLVDVAPNCTVAGSNPVVLTPVPGAVTEHVFDVTCT